MDRALLRQRGSLLIDAVGISVCVLASLAFYAATINPLLERRSVAAEQHRELEDQRQKAADLKASVSKAQAQLAAVRSDLAGSAIELEAATRINQRVAAVAAVFSRCGLAVDDIQTDQAYSGPRHDVVPITIVGRGPYNQCVEFLHGLNATFPDMGVVNIDLTGNPTEASGRERFRLELFWYAVPGGQTPNVSLEARSDGGASPS